MVSSWKGGGVNGKRARPRRAPRRSAAQALAAKLVVISGHIVAQSGDYNIPRVCCNIERDHIIHPLAK